jgi:hypothetical protein
MELNRTPLEKSLEPSRPVFGTPETIAERLLEYCEVGFTTALVEMPAPYDRETIERLAREVRPLVDEEAGLTRSPVARSDAGSGPTAQCGPTMVPTTSAVATTTATRTTNTGKVADFEEPLSSRSRVRAAAASDFGRSLP